jgi:hypothetical protein
MTLPRAHHLPLLLALALALGAGAAAPPARAQEGPTSTARYFPPTGWRPKEFSLVRDNGWFHLFYIRQNLIPGAPTQRSFGHAISRDLFTWTELDTILPVVPGTFEATQVWAPSVHRIGDTWWLFYAGMRDEPALGYRLAQSIGAATSSDLVHWDRRSEPLFDNRIFSWSYFDTTVNQGHDCRDPFLWWDEGRGEWLLFVATRPVFQPTAMVIGIAGSTDLEHWEDRGYVPITLPDYTYSDVAESPHLLTEDGSLLVLLWTTNAGQALSTGLSSDAVSGWNTSRRLRSMLGYSTLGWWGSEGLVDGARSYYAEIHDLWVEFWDLAWTAPDTFRVAPPDSFQLLDARFDRAACSPGDTVRLVVESLHGSGRSAALDFVHADLPGRPPLVAADLALPDPVVLTGDTTVVDWIVPTPPGGEGLVVGVHTPGAGGPGGSLAIVVPPSRDGGPVDPPPRTPRLVRPILARGGQVRFVHADPADGFTVRVFDARGREVWRATAPPGQRVLTWSVGGGAGGGRRAAPGVYFARVVTPGEARPEQLKVALPGGDW